MFLLCVFSTYAFGMASVILVSMIYTRFINWNQNKGKLEREMILIKLLYVDANTKSEIMSFVDIFGARVVDTSEHFLTIEVTGDPVKIESVLKSVRRFDVIKCKRSSKITFKSTQSHVFGSHTMCMLVRDSPKVLYLVNEVISQAGLNIKNLAFGPAGKGYKRITTVITGESRNNLVSEFSKIKDVDGVSEVTKCLFSDSELMLIKVVVTADTQRKSVLDIADIFRAEAAAVTDHTIILQFTGNSNKLLTLVKVLEPYGACEVARSGPFGFTETSLSP